ncbi:MAG: DUF1553 domain-containing protein, partial [Planctomycetales bacterium]|nr:DUF1553 domain-containing protein [Planctomycetales bacterium]
GVQIQCAQCHDHPWDSWKREQFHQLAAFFPRVALQPVRSPLTRSFEVAVSDAPERRRRPNNPDSNRATPEHYMPDMDDPQAQGTRMQPKFFLTGATLEYGTRDADRRGQLADWLTESPWFAKAMVNRMWAELVGEPLFDTIDDIGPEREPKSPQAVELLATEFAEHDYDVKWLIRAITATQAYERECRPRRGPEEKPMTANVAQRLRGDQLFSTILTALDVQETRQTRLGGAAERVPGGATPRLMFNAAFGFDPSVDKEAVSASIPQALALMNTPQINSAIRARPTSLLAKLVEEISDDGQLVDELYLRCLSREPSDEERSDAVAFCASVNRRSEAFEDLLWALLNSAEFAHRR